MSNIPIELDTKIVRFIYRGILHYGVLGKDSEIRLYRGSPYASCRGDRIDFVPTDTVVPIDAVRLKVPCSPTKIVCVGLNYLAHVAESGFRAPHVPILFLKPPSALVAQDEVIVLPEFPIGERVEFEGELGVIIGKTASRVTEDKAMDYVLGFTCVNDVSARYCQEADIQWTRAKSYDTFCPVGPCVTMVQGPAAVTVETRLNGQVRQSSDTDHLIFSVPSLIAFISNVMTLYPGDLIATGTPEGAGALKDGDVVEVTVGGVGTLRNRAIGPSSCRERLGAISG